jgi:hypothetical protein
LDSSLITRHFLDPVPSIGHQCLSPVVDGNSFGDEPYFIAALLVRQNKPGGVDIPKPYAAD